MKIQPNTWRKIKIHKQATMKCRENKIAKQKETVTFRPEVTGLSPQLDVTAWCLCSLSLVAFSSSFTLLPLERHRFKISEMRHILISAASGRFRTNATRHTFFQPRRLQERLFFFYLLSSLVFKDKSTNVSNVWMNFYKDV